MALNGTILGDAIIAAVDAAVAANINVSSAAMRQAMFRAIGTAIVTHIHTSGTVVVASVSLVTPGVGVSGVGTGTIV